MTTGKGSIQIDQERCKGCLLCVEHCPKKAISLSAKLNLKGYFVTQFNEENGCTGCATCALMCPEVAIEVYKS
jgi:2-oxoglutarate ferredoxin oxidoreductase subunit delta